MARKPTDLRDKINADTDRRQRQAEQRREEDRRRKELTDRQAKSYGTAVILTTGLTFDVDQIVTILLDAKERVGADPQLLEVWRERGRAFFQKSANGHDRPAKPTTSQPDTPSAEQATGEQPSPAAGKRSGRHHNDVTPRVVTTGRDVAPGAPDLLGRLDPDRPGANQAGEA